MVQPCSFLILLTAFSAMVMVHGAPLHARSSKHPGSDDNQTASKAPSDVSKLQTMPNGCMQAAGQMGSTNPQAGLTQAGPPVSSSGNSDLANSDPAGSAPTESPSTPKKGGLLGGPIIPGIL
ncbi:hypothetical protein BCR42DRAFT_421397 [Absidia repens]|uniref:Uncharacterized protein n=1 Tax=Absidia repens TaxID=90262 RepID=A0A1X2I8H3_9FUNG|nr:hypothetical protein BCR42DRAFT_421397 [Absidia repens]